MPVSWKDLDVGEGQISSSVRKTTSVRSRWMSQAGMAVGATLLQFALFSALTARRTESEGHGEQVSVYFANRNLSAGSALGLADVEKRLVDASSLSDAFITSDEWKKFEGRRISGGLSQGSPIPRALLTSEFLARSAPERIPPGKRLFVLGVSLGELYSILKPGDKVDVLANLDLPQVGRTTETLLEAAEVVGIGDDVTGENPDVRTRTSLSFHVTPDELKLLTYAEEFARFEVVLRNPNEAAKPRSSPAMTLNRFLASPRIQSAINDDLFQISSRKGSRSTSPGDSNP